MTLFECIPDYRNREPDFRIIEIPVLEEHPATYKIDKKEFGIRFIKKAELSTTPLDAAYKALSEKHAREATLKSQLSSTEHDIKKILDLCVNIKGKK